MRLLLVLVLTTALVSACAHTAHFNTDPSGATVYIDGEKIGRTPIEFSETTGKKTYRIKIEKEGFETIERAITQDQLNSELTIGAGAGAAACAGIGCVMGLFACWPLFWGGGAAGAAALVYAIFTNKQLKDTYMFSMELMPATPAASAQ